ncbi:MAG: enoyl-CoA hydratase/isomerase family protein [Alphaproteobacteria bacterium]|nr:enoyl-CoA hydratase/isomerase family protein [Alphaproteobacteria bacterium]
MPIHYEMADHIVTITIDRPPRNAMDMYHFRDLAGAWRRFKDDTEAWVAIVTGTGEAFCAGADVTAMAGGRTVVRGRGLMQRGSHRAIRALHHLEKPTIAAVRGPAVGIGWSYALACDMIVASETARFAQVFKRLGLAPDGGAVWFLTQRIGVMKAKELVFSARFLSGAEAHELGLVNKVVPDAELMPTATRLAQELAAGPTFALGLAKKLFHAAVAPTLDQFLETELLVQPTLYQTEDHPEGVKAFKEKRDPKFAGR